MQTYKPMQNLIVRAQADLTFLRQNTECGKVVLDIENHPGVMNLQVETSGDWFGVIVWQMDGYGLRDDKKSQRVRDALMRME